MSQNDIVPELLEKLVNDYRNRLKYDSELNEIRKRIEKGTAQSIDSERFSVRAGELLKESFSKIVKPEVLPNGQMYYNIANRIIPPNLKENFEQTSKAAVDVIKVQNQRRGGDLARVIPAEPDLNQDRIDGLVNLACSKESYAEVEARVLESFVNFSQSVHADTISENAKQSSKMGFKPEIKRNADSKCCEWCSSKAGTYNYRSDMDRDVFRRHENCRCTVEYDPDGSGILQDVHTREKGTKEELDLNRQKMLEQKQREKDEKEKQQRKRAAEAAARTDDPKFAEYVLSHPECLVLNKDKQKRHYPGTKEYDSNPGRSVLNLTPEEIQEMIYNLAGTGKFNSTGTSKKEFINTDRIAGIAKVMDENGNVYIWGETNRIAIHYSKSGCHVVPMPTPNVPKNKE